MLDEWYYLIVYNGIIILVKTIFETTTFVLKTIFYFIYNNIYNKIYDIYFIKFIFINYTSYKKLKFTLKTVGKNSTE